MHQKFPNLYNHCTTAVTVLFTEGRMNDRTRSIERERYKRNCIPGHSHYSVKIILMLTDANVSNYFSCA
jgi:hypothetical protein